MKHFLCALAVTSALVTPVQASESSDNLSALFDYEMEIFVRRLATMEGYGKACDVSQIVDLAEKIDRRMIREFGDKWTKARKGHAQYVVSGMMTDCNNQNRDKVLQDMADQSQRMIDIIAEIQAKK